jgi:hypothetical protein
VLDVKSHVFRVDVAGGCKDTPWIPDRHFRVETDDPTAHEDAERYARRESADDRLCRRIVLVTEIVINFVIPGEDGMT